ncbi:cell wall-recycling L,D-carboxypeptidase ElsL [Acinetobacter soli]|uniref:cell wall-recycling L,D-carboxypeptidase ElsL n=1 Tax=Acinetobacter soli TaxID=487316 RepID=UPI001F1F2CC5|nr:cell wall-recycling L,D-carboxypeptidase ElsL [Acinetobacter soli]MCE6008104.1 L,D-transpeptidase [Acinetobacter soli]
MIMFNLNTADIVVDLASQTLYLPKQHKTYPISSGKNGIGEQENSGKTPRGWHRIAEKFGHIAPINAVFIARQPTGEVYSDTLAAEYPDRDWILSRILWLDGLEEGFNRGEGCDSKQRYIYIHGTPDTQPMGIPMSHGCIRMRNTDLIELFEVIPEQALVYISEIKVEMS